MSKKTETKTSLDQKAVRPERINYIEVLMIDPYDSRNTKTNLALNIRLYLVLSRKHHQALRFIK